MSGIMFARNASGVGNPEIDDSERRHADVVKFGTVSQVDYATAKVRVKIGDEDEENGHLETGWLPMAGGRARGDSDWHPLEVGERVMVLSEAGEVQNGMVLPAALYTDDDPAPGDKAGLWRKKFSDGAVLEYDRDSGELAFTAISKATITVGGGSVMVQDDKVTLSVGGVSLEVSSDGVKITGGDVTHDSKNIGKDHKHLGVQTGGGVSGVPQ